MTDATRYDKAATYPVGHGYTRRPSGVRPQAVLIHSTNNSRPTAFIGEARFLFTSKDVSAHYLIGKSAQAGVVQFLDPAPWAAWHSGDCAPDVYQNPTSIGIELHISVGEAPTAYQVETCADLVRALMKYFAIPADRVATHRAVAVPPGRKRDPEGWNEAAFADWRNALTPTAPPASSVYTADSPLLGSPHATAAQAVAFILARPHGGYSDGDVATIVNAYWQQAQAVNLDPVLVVAQVIHESGNLTSFWSQRPQRNPAGIGVTGEHAERPVAGYAYNTQRGRWERGISFPSWVRHAIPAHLGRLLLYAIPLGGGTDAQRALITTALKWRTFPDGFRGSAPRIKALGRVHNPKGHLGAGWASPGDGYGAALAKTANAICEVAL
jgi:hypothetical protein